MTIRIIGFSRIESVNKFGVDLIPWTPIAVTIKCIDMIGRVGKLKSIRKNILKILLKCVPHRSGAIAVDK